MAFEVRYYKDSERRSSTSTAAIKKALVGVEFLKRDRTSEEFLYRYYNPDTRVECSFILYGPADEDEIGLAFVMEQPRATFFALEGLPLAVRIARDLRALCAIVDPDPPTEPERPTVEYLMARWMVGNEDEIEALEQEGSPPPRCSSEHTEIMWEYMTLRSELDRRYRRKDIPVPPVDLIQLKKTGQVFRCADWKGLEPTVLPDVDWFRLVNPPEPLKSNTYYSCQELETLLKSWFRDIPQPVYHRLCEKNVPCDDLIDALEAADRRTSRSFDRVDYEKIVDGTP